MLSTDLLERQLLDAIPATLYTLDLDGRLTSVHFPAARLADDATASTPRPDDIVGKLVWAIADPVFSRDHVEHAMHHLRTGRAPIVRWEIGSVDDGRTLLAQMTPLHDESRVVTGFALATTDVSTTASTRENIISAGLTLSRQLDLDRAYQEVAADLRRTVRADTVVIAIADDDTSLPRIVYDSGSDADRRALENRFGASWKTALGSRQLHVARNGTSAELTAPLRWRDSESFGAITVVVDDIEAPERLAESERFLVHHAAHLTAAVERARAVAHAAHRQRITAIGEVAAGVAHELRNPIFGISSAAQLLRFRAREDPVMEKNAGRILREVERLNRMVSTLLELGRPIALKSTTGDPDAVWDDVLETERGRLESRAVAIRRTRPDVPVSIPIDGDLLAQAFRGVLANAVEAAPEASDLTLHSSALPNGAWRCRITNGGQPIPAEMLTRVFEPFFSTKPGNTGVGLALVQRIIGEHHGTIGIESTPESGTTVSIMLPSDASIA